jgi:hypothetical protein
MKKSALLIAAGLLAFSPLAAFAGTGAWYDIGGGAVERAVGPHAAEAVVLPNVAGAGWQGTYLYTIGTGIVSQEFTYGCPAGLIASSGGFEFVGDAQADQAVYVTASGFRMDETPQRTGEAGWGTHFYFPAGAKAGTQVWFNAYCVK